MMASRKSAPEAPLQPQPHRAQRSVLLAFTLLSPVDAEEVAAVCLRLPVSEQARARRLLNLEDQLAFLAGRLLLRQMLLSHGAGPAAHQAFPRGPYGKPFLPAAPGRPDLRFSLSHAPGIVIAALTTGGEIGVDVEPVQPSPHHAGIAQLQFSAAEQAHLQTLPRSRQSGAFLELWTLKEALGKAEGCGLARQPVDCTALLLPEGEVSRKPRELYAAPWFTWQGTVHPAFIVSLVCCWHGQETLLVSTLQVHLRTLLR